MALGISMTRILREKWLGFGRRRQDYFSASNPQISAPASLTPTVISDTEIDLSWSSVVSATNYVLQRATQSDYSDAVQIYSGSSTSYNNTGLTGGTTYYYRVKAQATGYSDSDWTNANAVTPGLTTSNLTFLTNTLLTNTAQVFTPTSGAGFGHTGLETLVNLNSDQNGRVYIKYSAADAINSCFGFNATNAQTGFAGMEVGIDIGGDTHLYRINNGVLTDTSVVVSTSKFYAVYKVASNYKLQISTDEATWTDIGTIYCNFAYNNSAARFSVCDLFSAGSAKMYLPKVQAYSTGNLAKLIIQYGNSLGKGQLDPGNITLNNIGYQGWASLDTANDWFFSNPSVAGQDINGNILGLSTAVYPLFGTVGNSYSKIIVAEIEGTNQIHNGSTGAQAYTLMMTLVNDILNQDSRTCVMVYMMPNCDPAFASNTERLTYNGLLAGTAQTSRFKIVDITGTAALNDATAYLNATYYQADGIHLTQTGYNLLYSLAQPVITSF